MELVIVILGITIAFQLQVFNEKRTARNIELNAIRNLKKEVEINIDEFNSLDSYRTQIAADSKTLLDSLMTDRISQSFAESLLFKLVRTSTPDLQKQATQSYLENNLSYTDITLKNELLLLQTQLQEFELMSDGYKTRKQESFMSYLMDDVDFPNFRIISMDKIRSVKFRNIIWNQWADEAELNRLYLMSRKQLNVVDSLINSTLE